MAFGICFDVEKPTKKDESIVCFWTMARPPKQTLWLGTVRGVEGNKIMFTDGKNVIGEGTIIEVKPHEIVFTPLKRVNYPQPKVAPTRGFTYVERIKSDGGAFGKEHLDGHVVYSMGDGER